MKKRLCILSALFVLILAYMLIIWFCVPCDAYNGFFATEKIMRQFAPMSSVFLLSALLPAQLLIIALFLVLTFVLKKQLKRNSLLFINFILPSLCAFAFDVLFVKFKLIGYGDSTYPSFTVTQTTPIFFIKVTMFDILFALCVGLVTVILTETLVFLKEQPK